MKKIIGTANNFARKLQKTIRKTEKKFYRKK